MITMGGYLFCDEFIPLTGEWLKVIISFIFYWVVITISLISFRFMKELHLSPISLIWGLTVKLAGKIILSIFARRKVTLVYLLGYLKFIWIAIRIDQQQRFLKMQNMGWGVFSAYELFIDRWLSLTCDAIFSIYVDVICCRCIKHTHKREK